MREESEPEFLWTIRALRGSALLLYDLHLSVLDIPAEQRPEARCLYSLNI